MKVLGGLILVAWGVGLLPLAGVGAPLDRVVAVVDLEVILESELDEAVWLYRAQMGLSPTDTTGLTEFRRQVLVQLIDEKLLVAKAQREGLTVGTRELAQSLDLAVEEMRRSFGSEEAFLEELTKEKLTVQSLKDRYRNVVRQQILARRVMEQDLQPKMGGRPDPAEVRAFYETYRDSIPPLPEQVYLLAVLVRVQAGSEARESTRRRAVTVLGLLREGKEFAEAAREFSDGPEAARGGDIGYFGRGDLAHVPEFEDAAFSLGVGEIGGPVETSLGFHLVMPTARDGERVRVSQIVFLLKKSQGDSLRARQAAEDIRRMIQEGATLQEVQERHRGARGFVVHTEDLGLVPVENLKTYYREAIANLEIGQTSNVLTVPEGLQILEMVDRVPPHEATFEEIEPQLVEMVARQKMQSAYQEWMEDLRREIYIKVVED